MKHTNLLSKAKALLFVLFTCLFIPAIAQTPQYFSSGTGSNNAFPFGSTSSNKVQWIYIPSEFPGAVSGVITDVYFKPSTTGANKTFTNLTIKMGYTTATNTVTGAFVTTGFTTVYFAPSVTVSTTNGTWLKFTLTTPFYYDNTQNLLVEASQAGYTPSGFSVIQNSANGVKRLYGGLLSPTGTAGTGLANLGFDILALQNNAATDAITDPAPVLCYGDYDVKARIKNRGGNTISSVKVNWSVDGVVQPQLTHNTPMPINGTANITLGNVNFPMNKNKTIKVWTSEPNGMNDPQNSDDTVTIVRNAVDKPNGFVIVTGSPNICPGDSAKIITLNGNTNISYQWQFNAVNIPGATQSTYEAKTPGFYSVMFSNAACSAQSNFEEVVFGEPTANLGLDTSYCESGTPYALDAVEPNATYIWSTGANTQKIDILASGKYWVEIIQSPGCVASDTININVSPLPKVQGISYQQTGNTYSFHPSGLANDASYLWVFGDGQMDTTKSPVHTYPTEGTRNVTFVVFNDCGSDTVNTTIVPTSIAVTAPILQGILLYPNPAQNQLVLTMDETKGPIPTTIINSIGAVVYSKVLPEQEKNEIDITQLPSGSYIMKLGGAYGNTTRRFQVIK